MNGLPTMRRPLSAKRNPDTYVPTRISSLRVFSMTEDMMGENDCVAEIGHFEGSKDKLSVSVSHADVKYDAVPGEYLEGVKVYVDVDGYPDGAALCIEQDPEFGVVIIVEMDLPDGRTLSQKLRPFEITKSLKERS